MCTCIETIDDKLKEREAALHSTISLSGGPSRVLVSLIRTDKWTFETRRDRPKVMFCTFCPFCGVKYEEDKGPI